MLTLIRVAFICLLAALPSSAFAQYGNTGVSFTPTVQNAAYSSGNSLGGLQKVAFFEQQASAIFDNLMLTSAGGSVVAVTIYVYDQNPSNSTCTDKSAFSEAVADLPKRAMAPFVLTPGVVGAGATSSVAQLTQTVSVSNKDLPRTNYLYFCMVANGTVTPATTSDYVLKASGALDY